MSWKAFEESFINSTHRVMGRRLKPFCLWYQMVLEFYESPVLDPTKPLSFVDLEMACRICSGRFLKLKHLRPRRRPWKWLMQIRMGFKMIFRDIEKEVRKFDAYILDFAQLPETFDKPRVTADGRVHHDFPPALSVVSVLIRNNFEGGDRRKAFMLGLGEAHWHAAGFTRLDGVDLKMITDHDREFMEGMRKEREEKERKAKEGEIDSGTEGDGK